MKSKTWKQILCAGLVCWMMTAVVLAYPPPAGAGAGDDYRIETPRGPGDSLPDYD